MKEIIIIFKQFCEKNSKFRLTLVAKYITMFNWKKKINFKKLFTRTILPLITSERFV